MQENNFEKQAQKKMEGLILKPSDEVWHKLSVIITKRKSNRWVLAIMMLFIFFISSTMLLVWNNRSYKNDKLISGNDKPYPSNHLDSSKLSSPAFGKIPERKRAENANLGLPHKTNVEDNQLSNIIIHQGASASREAKANISIIKKRQVNNTKAIKNENVAFYDKKDKIKYKTRQQLNTLISHSKPGYLSDDTNFINDGKIILEPIIAGVKLIPVNRQRISYLDMDTGVVRRRLKDLLINEKPASNLKNAPGEKLIGLKEQKKWEVGLNFSAGIATTQKGYLGIIGGSNQDGEKSAFADQNQSNGQPPNIPRVPSKIKAGAGFLLGIFVQKNISPKTTFLIGVNYKAYRPTMMIGIRIDSIANYSRDNFFYTSGNRARYKNNFDFIELPVTLKIKPGRQKKAPYYLTTGISIAQLVASRALQFDTLSGNYVKNNHLFNKTQLSMSAGLLVSLSGKANNTLLIGPDINFSINKIGAAGLYKNRRYSYVGIMVQKSVGKK